MQKDHLVLTRTLAEEQFKCYDVTTMKTHTYKHPTYIQTSTLNDDKECLKLAARTSKEFTSIQCTVYSIIYTCMPKKLTV